MAADEATGMPYVGPQPFARDQTGIFHGRRAESRALLSLVIAHRVVVLYAASGAGKSSLINAGLIPLLELRGFEVLPVGRVRGLSTTTQGGVPAVAPNVFVANLLTSWARAGYGGAGSGAAAGADESQTLADVLGATEGDAAPPRAVIIDQFEEIFTAHPEHWRQRAGFFEALAQAAERDERLRVVLALREDHLAGLDPYRELMPEDLEVDFRLECLGPDAALEAITRPLQLTQRRFAPGVAEQLVSDLRTVPGGGLTEDVEGEFVEPVALQVVCEGLWSRLPPEVTVITRDHLQRFAEVDEALGTFYDAAVAAAATRAGLKEARLRAGIEAALITSGDTRAPAYRAERDTGDIPNPAVDELEARQLVRGELKAGGRFYELTHDRLIGPIRASNARFRAARARHRRRAVAAAAASSSPGWSRSWQCRAPAVGRRPSIVRSSSTCSRSSGSRELPRGPVSSTRRSSRAGFSTAGPHPAPGSRSRPRPCTAWTRTIRARARPSTSESWMARR